MKRISTCLLLVVIISVISFAQKDTVEVPSDYGVGEGSLNKAVQAAINSKTLSNTVFKLEPYGLYILNGTITTPMGQELEIVGPEPGNTQETAPPMIEWTSSGGVSTTFFFDCFGDVKLKNLWLLYANTGGSQVATCLEVEDDSLADLSGKGEHAEFTNVIFDYSGIPGNSSGSVGVTANHFRGIFENCYFKNCIDPHFRYEGRALSFPYNTTGYHIDSVLFENCTFANMGLVYNQEGGEYGDNVQFNHCTFLNVTTFPLESGWWYKMSVTNSIFVNTFMFGSIPSQDGSNPFGGTISIDSISNFGFSVPFTEKDRRILFADNSYVIQPWLVDWMQNNPYSKNKHKNRLDDEIPVPQPMLSHATEVFLDSVDANGNKLFPYMNEADLYDNTDPRFADPPTNIDSLKQFLYFKWYNNENNNWAYNPQEDVNQKWPVGEDLSYSNDTLKSAAMGGFPLGDLYRWWPSQYAQWKAQESEEHNRINTWLNYGKDTVLSVNSASKNIPAGYTLSQNYPNPFNPTTTINYSLGKSSHVVISIYNVLGEKIKTLVDGYRSAGRHFAVWNSKDDMNKYVASGIYLYRMEVGDKTIQKKMILLK